MDHTKAYFSLENFVFHIVSNNFDQISLLPDINIGWFFFVESKVNNNNNNNIPCFYCFRIVDIIAPKW